MGRPPTRPMMEFHGRAFYRDKRGYYVSQPRAGEQTTLLAHRWIWENEVGPIPEGWVVHHINHNPSDNRLENLLPMSWEAHSEYHSQLEENRASAAALLAEHARAGWERWRKSPEGEAELRDRMASTMARLNQQHEDMVCSYCGVTYQRKAWVWKRETSFCSPNCQNQYRRKSGKDDVDRNCEVCGTTFRTHKRMGGRSCSKTCKAELIRRGHLARQQP